MPSLTREEATERARLLSVRRYDVDLDLSALAGDGPLRTRCTIHFACRLPGAATFLDCAASTLAAATLNGSPLAVSTWRDGRLPLPALAAENVLTVESHQSEAARQAGVHRSVDPSDGAVYVWTTWEPDDARRVFGCFDQPDLKAVVTFTVTAPADWTVVSNSPLDAAPEPVQDGRRWRFQPTPPLATYVPVVNAGPFHQVRRQRDGFDLGFFCRRSLAGVLDADVEELVELTAAGLTFFGERFAMPFPQHKYDQVFVPDMGGAMENYGCVTWSDAFLFRDRPSQAEQSLRAVILLHEMAHMWFGDIVTMRWWDDLWLNEAFADWAAVWAAANATAYVDAWATFLTGRKEAGYAADRAPTTHPIRQPAPDVEAAAASFDMVTYAKGASVLKQLVAYVGESGFLEALRSYFQQHRWGNATLDDLAGDLEVATGRDLTTWRRQWLETAGTNTLQASPVLDERGRYRSVVIHQTAAEHLPELRTHRIGLGAYDAGDSGLVRRMYLEVEVTGEYTDVPELVGLPGADLLLLNDMDLAFASVRLDQRSLLTVLDAGAELPSPLSRALASSILWHLVVSAELPPGDFVRCATRVLRAETDETVRETLLGRAVEAADLWSPLAERAELCRALADACSDMTGRGGHTRTVALRGLARTATTDRQLDTLRQSTETDIDLRWRALIRLAVVERLAEGEVEELAAVDPNPDVTVRRLAVEAARPSPASKAATWEALITAGQVPTGAVREIATAFWQRSQDDVLAPFAERYADELGRIGKGGMLTALAVARLLYPAAGVNGRYPDRITSAAQQPGVSPLVARAVGERTAELRQVLAARELSSRRA